MSTRVLIPQDVQSLINEIKPYLSPEMKEIDVIRTVLVDFKLHQLNKINLDANGFDNFTKSKLLKAKNELENGEGKEFDSFEEVLKYAQNNS